jgi:hypothetical protein
VANCLPIRSLGSLGSHLGKMLQALFKLSIAGLPFLLLEYVWVYIAELSSTTVLDVTMNGTIPCLYEYLNRTELFPVVV